jgi:hypothetical protein
MWSLVKPGGRLILTVPLRKVASEEYIDGDAYGLLQPGDDGYVFWQRYYDQDMLQERVFSITGPPARMRVYGEKRPGLYSRNVARKMAGPERYSFWREPYMMGTEYRFFDSIDELPGMGVIGLSFGRDDDEVRPSTMTSSTQFPGATRVMGQRTTLRERGSGLKLDIRGAVRRSLRSEFAAYTRVPYAVTTSNGTTALHLAYLGLGIRPGDEIVVPGFAFMAAANVAIHVGAVPVFADVDRHTWCITAADVDRRLSPRTKAIVAVHTYGNVCAMDENPGLAESHGIPVIEDAAEAFASRYRGVAAGSLGAIGTFSFHATKTITTGEGGWS